MPQPLTIYFAGELFSSKHLHGNAVLAEEIYALSEGRYVPVLPQNLEQRDTTPHAIRDQDLKTVLSCDLGLFHYDGVELDSGTVVEYLYAKFADIPAVILRTDFRNGGDQAGDPWNLMTSYFPRTEIITLDSMALYKSFSLPAAEQVPAEVLRTRMSSQAGLAMSRDLAGRIVAAFDRVVARPPVLKPEAAETVYAWMAHLPGFREGGAKVEPQFLGRLQEKRAKGLV